MGFAYKEREANRVALQTMLRDREQATPEVEDDGSKDSEGSESGSDVERAERKRSGRKSRSESDAAEGEEKPERGRQSDESSGRTSLMKPKAERGDT